MGIEKKENDMNNIKKAYVLNLKRRPDRLIKFYDSYPYKKDFIEVVEAIDGKLLPASGWFCDDRHANVMIELEDKSSNRQNGGQP